MKNFQSISFAFHSLVQTLSGENKRHKNVCRSSSFWWWTCVVTSVVVVIFVMLSFFGRRLRLSFGGVIQYVVDVANWLWNKSGLNWSWTNWDESVSNFRVRVYAMKKKNGLYDSCYVLIYIVIFNGEHVAAVFCYKSMQYWKL